MRGIVAILAILAKLAIVAMIAVLAGRERGRAGNLRLSPGVHILEFCFILTVVADNQRRRELPAEELPRESCRLTHHGASLQWEIVL